MMMMEMKMWSLFLLVGLAVTFAAATAPDQSCKGRCKEPYRRGRLCECDPSCARYKTCCQDYQIQCGQKKRSDSGSEEWVADKNPGPSYAQSTTPPAPVKNPGPSYDQSITPPPAREAKQALGSCPQLPGSRDQGSSTNNPLTDSSSGLPAASPSSLDVITSKLVKGLASLLPMIIPPSSGMAPGSTGPSSSVPNRAAPFPSSSGPVGPFDLNAPPGSRLSSLKDAAQALVAQALEGLLGAGSPQGPAAGLPLGSDLCSDSPIDGLTALSNGTILVFKGKLFWSVDPQSLSVGPPQNITETLGIPSPIDTLFTRCDGQGKTYIFKGDQYWRLDINMKVEPGFPQSLSSGFSGLKGPISAALSQPETKGKPETVYFFKKGDTMQKFVFPLESTPSSSNKSPKSPSKKTGAYLGGEINLQISLKGFPLPITSALSFPNPKKSDTYDPYIFSGNLFFSIKISGDLPALVKPESFAAQGSGPQSQSTKPGQIEPKQPNPLNSIQAWLQCP